MNARAHQGDLFGELVIDSFAGGGGASTGIEAALGRPVDIAVNHDPEAIAMHRENHPHTRHYCENIWDVDPVEATRGRPVGLAWFSPDCTHFSRAKAGKPRKQSIRGLAWVVLRWAAKVRPRIICLENVAEFETWGPLASGKPCPVRKGQTFERWRSQLEALGYELEWRVLAAHEYGAPTTRKRLYLIARCDGEPISWPEPTHGPGRRHPFRTAADCIDWTLSCPSIFERPKPLAEKTLARIAEGMRRYVFEAETPHVVRIADRDGVPTLIQTGYGERPGQTPRVPGLDKPLGTVVAGGTKHALVAAFLAKHYGGVIGHGLDRPIGTVTARDHHSVVEAELGATGGREDDVRAFLTKYYGTGCGAPLTDPMHTVTSRDRFGLVMVAGLKYRVTDIGMRMLAPRELYNAQGFPSEYRIEEAGGKALTKSAQTRMAGNSVVPLMAQKIVAANAWRELAEVAA